MRKKIFLIGIACLILSLFIINTALAVKIESPLKWQTFEDLIKAIINFLFYLALAVVPLIIVIAGYFFVTSGGDPAKVTQARNIILYALIGLLIIFLSNAIIAIIKQIFKAK